MELREIASTECEWLFTDIEELDICSEVAVREFVKSHHVGVIINCAAYTNVDRAEQEQETAKRVNSDAVAILAKIAKEYDAKLIHISTDYIFGGEVHNTPIKEDAEPSPLGVYGPC